MKKKRYFIITLLAFIVIFASVDVGARARGGLEYQISGYVTTKNSIPRSNIKIEIIKEDQVLREHTQTNLLGYYKIVTKLEENTEYFLRVSGDGVQNKLIAFETIQPEISIDIVINQNPRALAHIESPKTAYVNNIINFSALGSYDPDEDPLSYYWDFGDGGSSEEKNATHFYSIPGEYEVFLQVLDVDGASDDVKMKIEIVNRSPIANHNGPYYARVGSVVQFSSQGSYDPDEDPIEFHWDFGDGIKIDGSDPEHVYIETREYKVKLMVIDVHGGKNEVETKCFVRENQAPIAESNGPYTGYKGIPIVFSSEGSRDLDGEILSYYWEFEDGQKSEEDSPLVIFQEIGSYSILLTVTDDNGDSDTDISTVEVLLPEKIPPIADCNGPYSGESNELITFSSSGSYDPDGDSLDYFWSYGNGESSNEANPRYRYSIQGTYTITLTVKDNDLETSTSTTTCTIRPAKPKPRTSSPSPTPNKPPVAKCIIPLEGETGQIIAFSSVGSYDSDGVISKYFWDFGDENFSTERNSTHIYIEVGNYTVTLTVTDNEDKTDDYVSIISILKPNTPPVILMNDTLNSKTGKLIQFTTIECYDPDGEITHYTWDFGDNTTSSLDSPLHNYTSPGQYNITIIVIDNNNASATGKSTVLITENLLPIGVITSPNTTKIGEIVEFSAILSYDQDGEIIQYEWDFGDGSISYLTVMNHTYLEEGEKNIKLVVTDDSQGRTEVFKKIQVTKNIPPIIDVNNSRRGKVLEELSFVSKSEDLDGDIISTLWEFGDGASATGDVVYHGFSTSGVYYGKITVIDDNFETNTENVEIVIYEQPTETIYPFLTLSVAAIISLAYLFRKPWMKYIAQL